MKSLFEKLKSIEFPSDVMGFSFTEFLVIFLSLIFAFAVAEFFISIGQLIKIRDRLKTYWEFSLWSTALICLFITTWFVSWLRLEYISISMLHFLMATLPNIMIFLIIAAFFPRIPERGLLELKSSFMKNRKWFFAMFSIYWGLNVVIELILNPPEGQNATLGLIFHFLVSSTNIFVDKPWLRTIYACFFLVQMLVFLFVF